MPQPYFEMEKSRSVTPWVNRLYFESPRASSFLGLRLVKTRHKNLVPLLSGVKPDPMVESGRYAEPIPVKSPVAKLHAYGLSPAACCLLGDYLSGRRQRVKISNARSTWETLAKGVPQGSILGPLLFNIFINDMFYFMEKCSLYNYADDNSLSNSAPSVDEVLSNLRHDCEISLRWFNQNGMEANPNKFQFFISSSCQNESIELKISDNVTITSEPCIKALGISIDSRLTFTDHISSCCAKAARQLNALSRISKNLDLKCRKLIFQSFVLSNFTYCPIVWHFCGKQNNGKIEKNPRTGTADTI